MSDMLLKRYAMGSLRPEIIGSAQIQAGHVYRVNLYKENGDPYPAPDPTTNPLVLLWKPQWGVACKKAVRYHGQDSPEYRTVSGASGATLLQPAYELDLGLFCPPSAGELSIWGGTFDPDPLKHYPDVFVSVGWRALHPHERPGAGHLRWRRTVWVPANNDVYAPKGAWGISTPTPVGVTIAYLDAGHHFSAQFPTTTPIGGSPWPLMGGQGQQVKTTSDTWLSWEIGL